MNREPNPSAEAAELRPCAEAHLREQKLETSLARTEADTLRLIHELEVHQIELERQKEELQLARDEAKFRRLYESMMDAFVVVDMAGRIQEFNSMYQEMLGYSEAELRELTYVDLTPERWRATEAGIIQNQVLRQGFSEVYEKEYRKKDGTVFPVELRT